MKPLAARAMRASLDGSEHRGTAQLRLISQRSEENSIGTSGESSIGIDSGAYTYTLTHRHRSKKKEEKAA